jgi:hypothetical protein
MSGCQTPAQVMVRVVDRKRIAREGQGWPRRAVLVVLRQRCRRELQPQDRQERAMTRFEPPKPVAHHPPFHNWIGRPEPTRTSLVTTERPPESRRISARPEFSKKPRQRPA